MCNGKTTAIKEISQKSSSEDLIVIKDGSQYFTSLISDRIKVKEFQKSVLVSSVNFFFSLFENIIPNLKQRIVILDRDLYDVLAYMLLVYEDDKSIEDFIFELAGEYKRLQEKFDIQHLVLTKLIDIEKCLKSKKRKETIERIVSARGKHDELSLPLEELIEHYNKLFVSKLLKLLDL
jgi:hypothetical protein